MIDKKMVIWTRISGAPQKMGELYTTDKESRFSYEHSYVQTGERGLGLAYPTEAFAVNSIVRPRSEFFDFHPPVQALLPPKSKRNLIRNLIMSYLNKMDIHPQVGLETDWQIITKSGHGSIGHLDIFADDHEAEKWYSARPEDRLVAAKDDFGFSLKEFLTWMDNDAETLVSILGPTPSLGGAIPKIPLSIPKSGWNGLVGLPTRLGSSSDITDIILKFEDSSSYPGIIELEKLALDIHKEAGFTVPRYWAVEINDIKALAVERFDRDQNNKPLFMESVYSLLASGSSRISHHYSASYDFIGKALDNKKIALTNDPAEAKKYLLKRLVLAMLTGNGDLHLENLSFIEVQGTLTFSPVYDPTPMRAYSRHDLLTPPEMSFGDYGDFVDGEVIGLASGLKRFAKSLKIQASQYQEIIADCLRLTSHYEQKINALNHLPDLNKENLSNIHRKIYADIKQIVD